MSGQSQGAARRLLGLETPLGPGAITVLALEGEDGLSRCFLHEVIVVTAREEKEIQTLLSQPVTLWVMDDNPDLRRPINGHVRRIVGLKQDNHGNRQYRLELVPRLWFMSYTEDCRIFQHQSIPDILRAVFQNQGLADVEFRLAGQYNPLEYCVQFRETGLAFVSRLMEHVGIFYWHEHSDGKHLLVIADGNSAAQPARPATVPAIEQDRENTVRPLALDYTFRPGKWTLNDYDFESPTKQLLVNTPTILKVPQMVDHEIYEYPGNYTDPDTGRQLTRLRIEMEEAGHERYTSSGNCAGFDPGRQVTITANEKDKGTLYLLTEVRYHGTSAGLEGESTKGPGFWNEFTVIRQTVPYRPERVTPWPHVRGTQTATVVGPAGEAIYCDEYGRVRVQFHWDRLGKHNETSSCWLRVAQARSGSNYGTQVIPHVGHEVLVTFIDGNPDRPLISGTVPNALNMQPVTLPDDKDKVIHRDHGDNRIVMQGKAGKQHLSLVSPKSINLITAGSAAKSLSAQAPQTGGSLGVTPSGPMQDQAGWNSLMTNYAALASAPLNAGSDPGDVNSFSAGKSNSITIGNINSWGFADSNSFVAGTSNSWVGADSNSTVVGNSKSLVDGNSDSTVIGNSTSTVGGDSTSTVTGATKSTMYGTNTSMTLGATTTTMIGASTTTALSGATTTVTGMNITTVTGMNISTVTGPNMTFVAGMNFTLSGPITIAISPGLAMTLNGFNVSNNGFNVATNSIKVKTTDGVELKTAGLNLLTAALHLFG